MFKKFKDKLAEEMKQSPARLQASVQQLAQAVVSPALSNSSIQEVPAISNDNFSLTEDGDETPKNTPAKHSFQTVDLVSPSPNPMEISRRSSVSSVTSDASSLFPSLYESPPNLYHLQSDLDQSASEVDDYIDPQLHRVTKDQLYSAYRKVLARYHKYRGRYTDLATHYRELDKVKSKLETVLVETQDKVLRRIADLKEQCQLEQRAKAHLEEALRNDIEEKDHVISTLNTKVKLLQASGPTLENDPIDPSGGDESGALSAENAQLKDKLKKLEALVSRYKESLKRNKEKFTEVTREKNSLENEHEALKNSTAGMIGALEGELSAARAETENLTEQLRALRRREEESAISLAENKLSVHRELEEKEEQIKQLRIDLNRMTDDRENLNEAIAGYKAELNKLRSAHAESNVAADKGTARHAEIKQEIEKTDHHGKEEARADPEGKRESENTLSDESTLRSSEREVEFQETRRKLDQLEKRCAEHRNEKESLRAELSACKIMCTELRNEHEAQKTVMEEARREADATIEKLQATVQSVDKELENMRNALIDRDHVCENYNRKMQQYAAVLEDAKRESTERETRIRSLEDKLGEKTKLSRRHEEDLEMKRTELSALRTELALCRSTIDDLGGKTRADSSIISSLRKERSDLTNRLVHYNDCIRRLKQDCVDVGSTVKQQFSDQRAEMSSLCTTLAASLARIQQRDVTLESEVDELRSKLTESEQTTSRETAQLRSELARVIEQKSTLEAELQRSDELDATNNKLIAEIDNLNFKIHDFGKVSHDLTQSQRQVGELLERLKALEDLESVNRGLSSEMEDLRGRYAEASRAFDQLDGLNAKLREATNVIGSLKSASGDRDAQLCDLRSEIARLNANLTEKQGEIKLRDERLASEAERVAHLESTCDSHVQTIEEHVRKYLNLEAEYQTTRESNAKELAGLMESNKLLRETVNAKLAQLKKISVIEARQSKTIEETNAKLNNLRDRHAELSSALETREKQVESLKLENAQLAKITLENKDLKDKHNDLLSRNERLHENEEASKRKMADYQRDIEELRRMAEDRAESSRSRQEETERLHEGLAAANQQLQRKAAELHSLETRLLTREDELREVRQHLDEWTNTAVASDRPVKEQRDDQPLVTLVTNLRNSLDEQATSRTRDLEDRTKELTARLNDLIHRQRNSESKPAPRDGIVESREMEAQRDTGDSIELSQNKSSNVTNDASREQLGIATTGNDRQTERWFDMDKLREENKRLEAQLDEALLTFQAKETRMQLMNNELRTQGDQLREQLSVNEAEQGMRLKQLVKEFQAQLHDKEEELQAALEKRFDRQQNYESSLVQQYKEQLKDYQTELSEKSELLENLVLEKRDAVAEKGRDIDRLMEEIARIKQEHADEMRELERKWKAIVQQRIDSLQTKHEEELNELTKEWQNERKPDARTEPASEELESTSRVAMAAIHTSTGSIHTLQRTLTSQKRELSELRKLVRLRQDTLEDSTEIEYLRNILFEYMMGRETMVLARVIAAVVKFDQEQTAKILKKEEDKLTLLGSLGLT